MFKKFVNSAAQFAVVVLNNLAERIDRAGQKVVRAQAKPTKAGAVNVAKKPVQRDLYKKSKLDAEATNSVMAKLNENLAKSNHHYVPTSRHS